MPEIISQAYCSSMNIFQRVHCRWNNFEAHDAMTSQPKRLLSGDGVWLFGAGIPAFLTPWLHVK